MANVCIDNLTASADGYAIGRTSNDSDVNDTSNYGGAELMPLYAQAFVIVIYSTITILAVGGNVIVCYIVLAYQRMRTVTNYFIVNLALSDILMSVLCVPLSFIANVLQQNASWPFGAFLCPVVPYAQSVSVFLSAFTLVAISLDRYIAIIYPLRPRMTSRQVAIVIALIWMFSMAVPLPVALVSRIVQQSDGHGQHIDKCLELWPRPGQSYVYSMVVMVLQYFLPLSVLSLTYSRIGVVIWVKRPPGEAESNRDQRMAASKRKMVKMMITVVIIYAVCWLPLHTITLIGDTNQNIWTYRYIQIVWISCHWFAMSNCCYNPMVYCWMNSRFRNGFKYALRACPCVTSDDDEHYVTSRARNGTYVTALRSDYKGSGVRAPGNKRGAPIYSFSSSPTTTTRCDDNSCTTVVYRDGVGREESLPLADVARHVGKGPY